MRLLLASLLLASALPACVEQTSPTEPTLVVPDSGRIVPGVDLAIRARWAGSCVEDAGWESDPYPCDEQPFNYSVQCTGPCKLGGDAPGRRFGHAATTVTLEQLGAVSITASITHDDGQTLARTAQLEVVPPEAFATMCFWTHGSADPDCNATTVRADRGALISVWAVADGRQLHSSLLRVNGHAPVAKYGWTGTELVVDLAELYPADVLGGRLRPGAYELDIELAGVTATHVITVR